MEVSKLKPFIIAEEKTGIVRERYHDYKVHFLCRVQLKLWVKENP
jgi:hypothetical protein